MIKFIEYKEKYFCYINEIVTDDNYELIRTSKLVQKNPQFTLFAKYKEEIAAISVFSITDTNADLIIYVNQKYRNKGIGRKLLVFSERKIRKAGAKIVYCIHLERENEKRFFKNAGYELETAGCLMIYSQGRIITQECKIIQYSDKYYPVLHNLITDSFHRMQVAVGLETEDQQSPPSDEERKTYLKNSSNIFLLEDSNIIKAALILKGNEIDLVAVDIKYQNMGYGKKIMAFAINKLIDDGFESIELYCIKNNPAEMFYENMGFKKVQLSNLVKRKL